MRIFTREPVPLSGMERCRDFDTPRHKAVVPVVAVVAVQVADIFTTATEKSLIYQRV
jgi:hypothetical protein